MYLQFYAPIESRESDGGKKGVYAFLEWAGLTVYCGKATDLSMFL